MSRSKSKIAVTLLSALACSAGTSAKLSGGAKFAIGAAIVAAAAETYNEIAGTLKGRKRWFSGKFSFTNLARKRYNNLQIITNELRKCPEELTDQELKEIGGNFEANKAMTDDNIQCFQKLMQNEHLDELIKKVKEFGDLVKNGKIWEKFLRARKQLPQKPNSPPNFLCANNLKELKDISQQVDLLDTLLYDIFEGYVKLSISYRGYGESGLRISMEPIENYRKISFYFGSDGEVVIQNLDKKIIDLEEVRFKL